MKNKILVFLFIFSLFGCKVSKSITEVSTTEETEKTYNIDTTLNVVQPIKAFSIESNYDEPVKIETNDFVFVSEISYDTGQRTYNFTPKKDTIKTTVKVNLTEKEVKKIVNQQKTITVKTGFNFFGFICWVLFAVFVLSVIRYLVRKYNLI